jgi:hypothetical protein
MDEGYSRPRRINAGISAASLRESKEAARLLKIVVDRKVNVLFLPQCQMFEHKVALKPVDSRTEELLKTCGQPPAHTSTAKQYHASLKKLIGADEDDLSNHSSSSEDSDDNSSDSGPDSSESESDPEDLPMDVDTNAAEEEEANITLASSELNINEIFSNDEDEDGEDEAGCDQDTSTTTTTTTTTTEIAVVDKTISKSNDVGKNLKKSKKVEKERIRIEKEDQKIFLLQRYKHELDDLEEITKQPGFYPQFVERIVRGSANYDVRVQKVLSIYFGYQLTCPSSGSSSDNFTTPKTAGGG